MREVGVGEHLMDAAINWAKGNKAKHILGRTFPGDRHMKNFYERFKITARLIEVSKKLDQVNVKTFAIWGIRSPCFLMLCLSSSEISVGSPSGVIFCRTGENATASATIDHR